MSGEKLNLTQNPDLRSVQALLEQAFDEETARLYEAVITRRAHHKKVRGVGVVTPEKEVVAFAALLPFWLVIDGLTVEVGEIGFVATSQNYRYQGLFRRIHGRLMELAQRANYPLTVVFGIPGFYRRFGYGYAPEFDWRSEIDAAQARALPADRKFIARKAGPEDGARLHHLREQHVKSIARIYTPRSTEMWRWQIETAEKLQHAETLVLEKDEEIFGYIRVSSEWGKFALVEAVGLTVNTLRPVLRMLGGMAEKKGKTSFLVKLPGPDPLAAVLCHYGASEAAPVYGLQSHILDTGLLLEKLRPVLEQRLAHSPFADLSCEVPITIYPKRFHIAIQEGRVINLNDDHSYSMDDCLRMGAETFLRLVLGRTPIKTLIKEHRDVRCPATLEPVINTLFPQMAPHICPLDAV